MKGKYGMKIFRIKYMYNRINYVEISSINGIKLRTFQKRKSVQNFEVISRAQFLHGAVFKQDVFVKFGCPRKQSQNMAKSQKSYIFTPPQGHVMLVKSEEPLDELTVQGWLLYDHLIFKYCTLYVRGTELQTKDKQRDKQTDTSYM